VFRDDFGESDSFFENEMKSNHEPASQQDARAKVRAQIDRRQDEFRDAEIAVANGSLDVELFARLEEAAHLNH
jgi:hypothetical protein